VDTFFVSPDGNGNGSKKNPASIYDITRLKKAVDTEMNSDSTIFLTDGCYRLKEPVILRSSDSGQNGFNIRWQNAPG